MRFTFSSRAGLPILRGSHRFGQYVDRVRVVRSCSLRGFRLTRMRLGGGEEPISSSASGSGRFSTQRAAAAVLVWGFPGEWLGGSVRVGPGVGLRQAEFYLEQRDAAFEFMRVHML